MTKLNSKTDKLQELGNEVLSAQVELADIRRANDLNPVIGQGNHNASVMFIGEAPGAKEAATGQPFVGRAGKVLDELLHSIELAREDVYITNIVKDRPPKNRDPTADEIDFYAPWLDQQVAIIQPLVLVTLGRFSMEYIMNRYGLTDELKTISQAHGHSFITQLTWGEVKILPLYHPAVALYNPAQKQTLLKDFKVLKNILHT